MVYPGDGPPPSELPPLPPKWSAPLTEVELPTEPEGAGHNPDAAPRWRIIGIDPGPVVGLCVLEQGAYRRIQTVRLVQADSLTALMLVMEWGRHGALSMPRDTAPTRTHLVVERFVDGRRSARVAGRHGSQAARDFIANLGFSVHRPAVQRNAAQVKPWATDRRLSVAGIEIANPSTMRHALDAGRHALYAAVFDCGWPDPLTTQGKLFWQHALSE